MRWALLLLSLLLVFGTPASTSDAELHVQKPTVVVRMESKSRGTAPGSWNKYESDVLDAFMEGARVSLVPLVRPEDFGVYITTEAWCAMGDEPDCSFIVAYRVLFRDRDKGMILVEEGWQGGIGKGKKWAMQESLKIKGALAPYLLQHINNHWLWYLGDRAVRDKHWRWTVVDRPVAGREV